MAAPAVDEAKLEALAALTDGEIGVSEEDVKIRFAVPLLEALGHQRLAFEHRGKDILLRERKGFTTEGTEDTENPQSSRGRVWG